jgi:serine/threonine protein kinase
MASPNASATVGRQLVVGRLMTKGYDSPAMGDSGDGGSGSPPGIDVSYESVTGVGGPVLLVTPAPELGRGDVLSGRYQIEMVLGTGGSGRVLRAFDRLTRSPVALKILRPEFLADPVWTERFSRELRVGRQIQHPNVCRVFDIGESDGHRFLSMELAVGGTIRAQLEPSAPARSIEDRVSDARALIGGVTALHAAGIVHRDLKPENILRMADGRLVITDFGLATDPGAGPATTVMIGTPRYMAPEVVMGDPATARSDVWALGVVLHEILFGRRPDRSMARRGYRHFVLPEVNSIKEQRLAELCGRCSDDDPQTRPASAVEVERAFQVALLGRRFTRVAIGKQAAWAAVALLALGTLGLIRSRWTNSAVASSSHLAGSMADHVLQSTGTPVDWSKGSTKLAAFSGRIHCFSSVDGDRKVRIVWGTPRRAEDIDAKTGTRVAANLLAETYADGCPQTSPNGKSLLFERASDTGSHLFLAPSADGRNAKQIASGSNPKWLPNGEEFVFALDSRHAAIFALPTGEMTVVADGDSSLRHLSESAVDSTGTRLAILYATPNNEVVVHGLPSLEVLRRIHLPVSAQKLRFSSSGALLFTIDGPGRGARLASLDLRHGDFITNVGAIVDSEVTGTVQDQYGWIVAGHSLRKNLWLDRVGGASVLTSDGESSHGSMSLEGNVVIQRRLSDGRLAMVLRPREGPEQQITAGPIDVTPTFLPDGKSWLYAKLDRRQLVECRLLEKTCAPIHSDPLVPGFPSPSPSGSQVAYLTLMNGPRLRIVFRTGGRQRDLGPAGGDACAPFWSAENRIWVARSMVNAEITWAEFDTESGQRTGNERTARNAPTRECTIPEGVRTKRMGHPAPTVFAVSQESSELIRAVSGPPGI